MTGKTTKETRKGLTVTHETLLRDGSDHDFRQFLHDTLAFGARLQDVRNRLAAVLGLTGTQYTILISVADLEDNQESVGINRIAHHLHLSGAFVTIEVNRLVTAGLVRKDPNPEDRRRVLLSITDKGRAELARLTSVQRPVNDTLFSMLSPEDFARLSALMPQLVDSSDKALRQIDYLTEMNAAEG